MKSTKSPVVAEARTFTPSGFGGRGAMTLHNDCSFRCKRVIRSRTCSRSNNVALCRLMNNLSLKMLNQSIKTVKVCGSYSVVPAPGTALSGSVWLSISSLATLQESACDLDVGILFHEAAFSWESLKG